VRIFYSFFRIFDISTRYIFLIGQASFSRQSFNFLNNLEGTNYASIDQ